jgi:hypothetical protein
MQCINMQNFTVKGKLLIPIQKAITRYTLIEILGVVSLYAVAEQSVAHTNSGLVVPPKPVASSVPYRFRHAHFPFLQESSFGLWSVHTSTHLWFTMLVIKFFSRDNNIYIALVFCTVCYAALNVNRCVLGWARFNVSMDVCVKCC